MSINLLLWQERNPMKGGAESWLDDLAHGLRSAGHSVAWLYSAQIEQALDVFLPAFVIVGTIHNFIGLEHAVTLADRGTPAAWFLHDYWPFCGPRMLMQQHNQSDVRCEAAAGVCENSCGGRRSAPTVLGRFYTVTGNEHSAAIFRRNGVRIDGVVEEGVDVALFKPGAKRAGSICASAAWNAPWKGMHVLQQAVR